MSLLTTYIMLRRWIVVSKIFHPSLLVCSFVWVLWQINLCRLSYVKSISLQINISTSNNSVWHKYSFCLKRVKCPKLFYFKQFSLTVVQFQCQKQFYFKQVRFAKVRSFLSFDSKIGSYQVLPLQARVNLGAMAIKGYSAFPKAPALLESHHQVV